MRGLFSGVPPYENTACMPHIACDMNTATLPYNPKSDSPACIITYKESTPHHTTSVSFPNSVSPNWIYFAGCFTTNLKWLEVLLVLNFENQENHPLLPIQNFQMCGDLIPCKCSSIYNSKSVNFIKMSLFCQWCVFQQCLHIKTMCHSHMIDMST